MQTYLVLLHEGTTAQPVMSPEEMQAVIARYKAWGQRLHASGRLVSSNKLENDTGRVLRRDDGQIRITDGRFTETKDVFSWNGLNWAKDFVPGGVTATVGWDGSACPG